MSQSHVARFRNPLSPPWIWTRAQKVVWENLEDCIRGDRESLHLRTRSGVGLRTLLARLRSVSGFDEFAIDVATVSLTPQSGRLQIVRCDGIRRDLYWTLSPEGNPNRPGVEIFEWPKLSPKDLRTFLDRCGWIECTKLSLDATEYWIEAHGDDLNRVQKDLDRWYRESSRYDRLCSSWLRSISKVDGFQKAA